MSIFSVGRNRKGREGVFVVAELSANHNQDPDQAIRLVREAAACGADAVKLQTYTPDTLTIDCDKPWFQIGKGTIWEGKSLYQLYGEAYTPWEWHPRLRDVALEEGIGFFSTPFDYSAVEFLESLGVVAHKIASFEVVDLELIRKVASTGKPVIMSTGMATEEEITEAVDAARIAGCRDLVLLKCTSAYPAPFEAANLRTIPDMARRFGVPVGLSDHTPGIAVPVAAVALGACVIEKHFTLSRAVPGPDSAFSLEPDEFRAMVDAVRIAEKALGNVSYGPSEHERASVVFRRSLFVVRDMAPGEVFDRENVRSIRPGNGLAPKHLSQVLGKHATRPIERGTPLDWELVS
ncbi:MAG: pseudaminic acid synthase [Thermoanaerobaculaceae bacterium]